MGGLFREFRDDVLEALLNPQTPSLSVHLPHSSEQMRQRWGETGLDAFGLMASGNNLAVDDLRLPETTRIRVWPSDSAARQANNSLIDAFSSTLALGPRLAEPVSHSRSSFLALGQRSVHGMQDGHKPTPRATQLEGGSSIASIYTDIYRLQWYGG